MSITLFDEAGNEITIFIDAISSCSYMRDESGTCTRATLFMRSGERHQFIGEDAVKLEAKIKAA